MRKDDAVSVRPFAVIILAAGEGKRMKSAIPKVLHPVAGRSLLGYVIEAAAHIEPEHVMVVVGHGREQVARDYLAIGRGYATAMSIEHGVSPRTVVSWVEKARQRGILTPVPKGGFGGRVVSKRRRRKH